MAPDTPLQGLILDVDGTLLRSMPFQYEWLKGCAEKFDGLTPFPADTPEFWAQYNDMYDEKGMLGLYELIQVDFERHGKEIWPLYNEFNRTHTIDFAPGVVDAVKEIHRRSRVTRNRPVALRMAANTTKSWKDVETQLARVDILPCLDCVITKDDIYNHATDGAARRKNIPFDDFATLKTLVPEEVARSLEKPNSYASWLTVERLGVDIRSVIAFEDTRTGIRSCKQVLRPRKRENVYVVGVTWGYESAAQILAAGADEVIDRPEQMVELVGDLSGFS